MIAVQQFTSASEMMAHYRSLFSRRAVVVPVERCRPVHAAEKPPEPPKEPPYIETDIDRLLARFKEVHLGMKRGSNAPSDEVGFPSGILMKEIMMEVVAEFRIHPVDLRSKRRTLKVIPARHALMYLLRKYTTRSLPEIGLYIGGKDHTTVLHGVRTCEKRMGENAEYRAKIEAIEARLGVSA